MKLGTLDHVNIHTANLDAMVSWYDRILGMTAGDRPPFPFPGAWLYAGDQAAVHLVGIDEERRGLEPKLEHFAITATGLTEFLARLEKENVAYELARVPGYRILQVNLHDCDGNHIHIDFSPEEADAAGL